MTRRLAMVLAVWLQLICLGSASAECFDFQTDPNIAASTEVEEATSYSIDLGHAFSLPDGDCISMSFRIEEGVVGQPGHHTEIGPIPSQETSPRFRLNLHYDATPISLSLSSTDGGESPRHPLEFQHTYHAVCQRQGSSIILILYQEDGTHNTEVFSHILAHEWSEFQTYQIGLDHVSGGEGTVHWGPETHRIDFLVDRQGDELGYLSGWIGYLCVEDGEWCTPTPPIQTSWGAIRSGYR